MQKGMVAIFSLQLSGTVRQSTVNQVGGASMPLIPVEVGIRVLVDNP